MGKIYVFIRKYLLSNENCKNIGTLFQECHGCTYSNLLDEVISKYLRMSSSQFKREFVRSMGTGKEMGHRKQVQCSKRKTVERWSMKNAYNDRSVDKMATHRHIQSELENDQGFLRCSEFKRYDLLNLASAYNVSFKPKQNKHEISVTLSQIILKANKMIKPDMLSSPGTKIVSSTFM